jgi:hypothetical protein
MEWQLLLTRGLNAPEHRWLGADEMHPAKHEGVKMDVEIERRAKSLD